MQLLHLWGDQSGEGRVRVQCRQRLFLPALLSLYIACSWNKANKSTDSHFLLNSCGLPLVYTTYSVLKAQRKLMSFTRWSWCTTHNGRGLPKSLSDSVFPLFQSQRRGEPIQEFSGQLWDDPLEKWEDEMACESLSCPCLTFGPFCLSNFQATFSASKQPSTAEFSLLPSPQVNLQETPVFWGE